MERIYLNHLNNACVWSEYLWWARRGTVVVELVKNSDWVCAVMTEDGLNESRLQYNCSQYTHNHHCHCQQCHHAWSIFQYCLWLEWLWVWVCLWHNRTSRDISHVSRTTFKETRDNNYLWQCAGLQKTPQTTTTTYYVFDISTSLLRLCDQCQTMVCSFLSPRAVWRLVGLRV